MNITISGKITHALTPRTGTSSRGNEWKSQDFVIESEDGTQICFNVFGEDKITNSGLKVGVLASVTCEIKSKEWNGKWFTGVTLVNCIVQGGASTPAPKKEETQKTTVKVDYREPKQEESDIDSLPF